MNMNDCKSPWDDPFYDPTKDVVDLLIECDKDAGIFQKRAREMSKVPITQLSHLQIHYLNRWLKEMK